MLPSTENILTSKLFETTTKALPTTSTTTPTTTTTTTPSATTTTAVTTTTAKIKVGLTENIPFALLQSSDNFDNSLNVIHQNNGEKKQNVFQNSNLIKKNEEIMNVESRISNQNISIKALSCHLNRMIAYLDVRNMKDNFNIYLGDSNCKFFVNTLNVVQNTIELPINYNGDCGTIMKEYGSHDTYINKLYYDRKAGDVVRDERSLLTVKCRFKKSERTGGQMHAKLKKSGKYSFYVSNSLSLQKIFVI